MTEQNRKKYRLSFFKTFKLLKKKFISYDRQFFHKTNLSLESWVNNQYEFELNMNRNHKSNRDTSFIES